MALDGTRVTGFMRFLAMSIVIMFALAAAYLVKSTPDSYQESATVVFSTRAVPAAEGASYLLTQSLISAGEVMIQSLVSADSEASIRRSGGTAKFDIRLMNFHNQDIPEYDYPLATLSVQAAEASRVRRTFRVVLSELRTLLAQKQAGMNVPNTGRIGIVVVNDTGPVLYRKSLIRAYAALVTLAVVGVGTALNVLRRCRVGP